MEENTKSRGGLALGGFIIAIAAALVGAYGGSQLTATFLVNQNINKDARNVQTQVKVLKYLHSGDTLQAVELLESGLDDDLVLFDPQEPYEGLSEQTEANIEVAIKQAKAYREEYPRKSDGRAVNQMVDHLFEKTGK